MKAVVVLLVFLLGSLPLDTQSVEVAFRISEKDLIPEGIAYDATSRSFFVSSIHKNKIIRIDERNKVTDFIKHALSPAKIASVELNEEEKTATAKVANDQFSLAIGRNGQNVRLAAELTGWKITVVEEENEENVVSSEEAGKLEIEEGEEPKA